MPRPLSSTEIELSVWMVTVISSQKSASASSTELSTTSNTMWCRPVPSEVSPMYMPGRLRTASRPLSTLMLLSSYSPLPTCCGFVLSFIPVLLLTCVTNLLTLKGLAPAFGQHASDAHRHDDVLEIVVSRNGDQGARVGVAQSTLDLAAVQVVEYVLQIVDVEAYIQRLAGISHVEFLLRFFLFVVAADDLQAAVDQHPAHAFELLIGEDRSALQGLQQHDPVEQ